MCNGLGYWSIAVNDFNNDDQLDFVVTNIKRHYMHVYLGYGNGSFANVKTYPSGVLGLCVTTGDLDNDT
ncbi:unnamed protein product, partial [Rotaria magnacalcarata]